MLKLAPFGSGHIIYYGAQNMKNIVPHWGNISFPENEKPYYEKQFKDDINRTREFDAESEVHVYFEAYTIGQLSGVITDSTGKKLCSFTCSLLANNTTTINFAN